MQGKIEDLLSRRNEVLEVDGTLQGAGATGNAADYELRISDAHRKMDVMRTKFERLRTVCISSDQALKGVLDRVKVALREMEPSDLAPASKIPQGTPPRQSKKLDRRERHVLLVYNSLEGFFYKQQSGWGTMLRLNSGQLEIAAVCLQILTK